MHIPHAFSVLVVNSISHLCALSFVRDHHDADILIPYRLSPDVLEPLNLRNHKKNFSSSIDAYIRISLLSMLFFVLFVLACLVIYGIGRWMTPSIFADKRKLRYMLLAGMDGKQRGRNKICIVENGCSGGSMNQPGDPSCRE